MNGLDTLKLAKRLEEHGFERKQAEGVGLELQEVIAMAFKDIATKSSGRSAPCLFLQVSLGRPSASSRERPSFDVLGFPEDRLKARR
jgi:hypothetical protein